MLKFSWISTISQERVLTIANIKCEQLQTIKTREIDFVRVCDEKSSIANLSLTGKVEGKRARGRQNMIYRDNVKDFTNTANGSDLIHACEDRKVWKRIIVDTLVHDI